MDRLHDMHSRRSRAQTPSRPPVARVKTVAFLSSLLKGSGSATEHAVFPRVLGHWFLMGRWLGPIARAIAALSRGTAPSIVVQSLRARTVRSRSPSAHRHDGGCISARCYASVTTNGVLPRVLGRWLPTRRSLARIRRPATAISRGMGPSHGPAKLYARAVTSSTRPSSRLR